MRRKLKLCENIKEIITKSVDSDELMSITFSVYLSTRLFKKYSYLSKIFLKQYNISIKHYFDLVKIERIKKLINEHSLTMKEIAYKMHYSSPSHLSHQFKVITNQTPSEYKIICDEDT